MLCRPGHAWVQAENKFKCPCHGSQYNAEGKVVRGPAPLVGGSAKKRLVEWALHRM